MIVPRIYIGHHFWGSGNIGDDLMLAGFLAACEQAGYSPDLTCAVLPSVDLASQKLRFPQIRWLQYDDPIREAAIREADVWLGLGDTPFQMDSGTWFEMHLLSDFYLCSRHNKPMYFLGIGVESAQALDTDNIRTVLGNVNHVWTRDAQSAALLGATEVQNKITVGADLANIVLAMQERPQPEPNSIAFVLNFERPEAFSQQGIVDVLDRTSGARQFWLAQEVRAVGHTERALYAELPEQVRERVPVQVPDYAGARTQDLLATWPSVEQLVSSRYHALLVGAWQGSRLVAIERSAKVWGLTEQLRLDQKSCAPNLLDADEVLRAMSFSAPADRALLHGLAAKAENCIHEFFRLWG